MRGSSVGLSVVQVMCLLALLAIFVWIALGVAVGALIVWGIYHLAVTISARRRTLSPTPILAYSATNLPAPGHPSPTFDGSASYLRAPPRPPAPQLPPGGVVVVERTSWVGLSAVVLLAVSAIPFWLGDITALGLWIAFAAFVCAVNGWARAVSKVTNAAMIAVIFTCVLILAIGGVSLWSSRDVPLYGENHGERQGEMTEISQLQAALPCVTDEVSPATSQQEFYNVDLGSFVASSSCLISRGEEALPVVFVQASDAAELESLFASGVIVAENSSRNELWVQRDGAVAVITADEESNDLAQEVGATWISLNERDR